MESTKSEARNAKRIQMTKKKNTRTKHYDLEDRTKQFAKDVRVFVCKLPRTIANIEDAKQLVRSSGSIGANYIEANEALSKKDFIMRVKISRKEAKESVYWLELFSLQKDASMVEQQSLLIQESTELMMILSAIIRKSADV